MPEFTFELDPLPGIDSDDTAFAAKGRWADCNNVRTRGGKPETIGRYFADHFTGGGNAVNAMLAFKSGTDTYIAFGSPTKLSYTQASSGAVTQITMPDASPYGAWFFDLWGTAKLLAVPSGGKLYQWNAGDASATAVTQAPARITSVVVTDQRQVLAFGCDEEISTTFNPMCIRGSDLEDYTDWTSTSANNAFEHILQGNGTIVAAAKVGAYIAVWTESTLYIGQFLGDPGQTYRFDVVATGCGLVGPRAFTVINQGVFWISEGLQLYFWQPGQIPAPIPNPIYGEFVTNCERGQEAKSQITVGSIGRFGEIWAFYSDIRDDHPAAINTRYIAYSMRESVPGNPVWFRGDFGRTAMLDHGLIHALYSSQPAPVLMATQTGGVYLHELDAGLYLPWSIQSADQYIESGRRRIMIQRISHDFETLSGKCSLTLYMRDRPLSAPVIKGPYTLTGEATGYLVDGSIVSGASTFSVNTGTGAIAAGRMITFAGINAWAAGADTGVLAQFILALDCLGGSSTITLTQAIVSSGGNRNVVSMPTNGTAVTVLGTAAKRDFRASGMIASVKFSNAGGNTGVTMRLGKPTFSCATLGQR